MKTNTITTTTIANAIAITAIGSGIVALVASWVSLRSDWRSVVHGVRVVRGVVSQRLLGQRLGLAMLVPAMAGAAAKRCRAYRPMPSRPSRMG